MSYDTNWAHDYDDSKIKKLKAECDKLARIACKAMTQLEKSGRADFILIEDDEVRDWWTAHKEADRKERERVAEIERRERVKAEALARLSDEEKELLGLAKPKSAKKHKKVAIDMESVLDKLDMLKESYVEWDDTTYMSDWTKKAQRR